MFQGVSTSLLHPAVLKSKPHSLLHPPNCFLKDKENKQKNTDEVRSFTVFWLLLLVNTVTWEGDPLFAGNTAKYRSIDNPFAHFCKGLWP